ncbi:hypothetical protein JKF63_05974 [Porcisia hertigi]|uniref:Uncharacterized protein n=1 Tax=Porcisia hertigi TaxID=2761500 RepID=A0A836IU56_9TRYP|nr:hypothetical protein JKF63_05974 [Porcisia hertigi]
MQSTFTESDARGRRRSGSRAADAGQRHDYDAPRLGEVPVRSKYHRADQEKSHFANHPTYLPLAEQCGPPQPSILTNPTPGRGLSQNYEQHEPSESRDVVKDKDYQEEAEYEIGFRGCSHACTSLRDDAVKGTRSIHQPPTHIVSVSSNTSTASSVGPTGLVLVPPFCWVPKHDGAGRRFNPFVKFRSERRHVGMALMHPVAGMSRSNPLCYAEPPGDYKRLEPPYGAIAPEHLHQKHEEQRHPSIRPLKYGSRDGFSSPLAAQMLASPSGPHGEASAFSFYGPIGFFGIEALRKRHALEKQSGRDGAAECDYKERRSRRPLEGEETGILLLTQLWCDVRMLHDCPVVDSPRLPSDDDGEDEAPGSGGDEASEERLVAREKMSWRRSHRVQHQQSNLSTTDPTTLLVGSERPLDGWDKMAVSEDIAREVTSLSSPSRNSDDGSRDDVSKSDASSPSERSASSTSDDDESTNDNNATDESTGPPSWKNPSSFAASPKMGRSLLGDAPYDFMNSSIMHGSLVLRMPGGARAGLLFGRNNNDSSHWAAAATARSDPAPNHARRSVSAQSADMSKMSMTVSRRAPPMISTPVLNHCNSPLAMVTRGSVLGRGDNATAPVLPFSSQRGMRNTTGMRSLSIAMPPHTQQHRGGNASGPSDHTDGGGTGVPGLEEEPVYGSSSGLGGRRDSYFTTPCEEGRNVKAVAPSVYGVARSNLNTTSPKPLLLLTERHDKTSISMGEHHDGQGNTLSPSPLRAVVGGPKSSLTSAVDVVSKKHNTTQKPPTLPLIGRGIINPAAYSQPHSTAQKQAPPLAVTSSPPRRLPQGKEEKNFPGGYLTSTPPGTPKFKQTPNGLSVPSNNTGSVPPLLVGSTSARTAPGWRYILGAKSRISPA